MSEHGYNHALKPVRSRLLLVGSDYQEPAMQEVHTWFERHDQNTYVYSRLHPAELQVPPVEVSRLREFSRMRLPGYGVYEQQLQDLLEVSVGELAATGGGVVLGVNKYTDMRMSGLLPPATESPLERAAHCMPTFLLSDFEMGASLREVGVRRLEPDIPKSLPIVAQALQEIRQ